MSADICLNLIKLFKGKAAALVIDCLEPGWILRGLTDLKRGCGTEHEYPALLLKSLQPFSLAVVHLMAYAHRIPYSLPFSFVEKAEERTH